MREFRLLARLALALLPLWLLGAAVGWLGWSEPGLNALLRTIEAASGARLIIGSATGRLLGPLRLSELRYEDERVSILLRDVSVDWDPARLFDGEAHFHKVEAASVDLVVAPSEQPARIPESLALPVAVVVDRLAIGRLKMPDTGGIAVEALEASLISRGDLHEITALRFASSHGRVEASGTIGTVKPFALRFKVALEGSRDGQAYRVHASGRGALAGFQVEAQANGVGLEGKASVDVAPFAAVFIKRLQGQVGEIDPSAFQDGAPRAAITLRADLAPAAEPKAGGGPLDWPVGGTVEVDNRMAGTIDRGLIPVQQARGRVHWEARRLAVSDMVIGLPGGGRAVGAADWDGKAANARVEVSAVDLAVLHGKLKPTRISGQLVAEVVGDRQSVRAELSDPRFTATFHADKQGSQVELRTARLAARGAALDFRGGVELAGSRAFRLSGRLDRFDPSRLARLPAASLNAEFSATGKLAPSPAGRIEFVLRASRLLGLALTGRGAIALAANRLEEANVSVHFGENRLDAAGAYGAPGDRLDIRLEAPRLASLGIGVAGSVSAEATLGGTPRQPAGEFRAHAADLVLPGGHFVRGLRGSGYLRDGVDGPLKVTLEATGYRRPGSDLPAIRAARLEIDGTRAAHRITATADVMEKETVELAAHGGLGERPAWSGMLDEFVVRGNPLFAAELVAPASLDAKPDGFVLGPTELRWRGAKVKLAHTEWRPDRVIARGDLSGLQVGVVPGTGERVAWRGDSLRLRGRWNLILGEHANGSVEIEREAGDIVLDGEAPVKLGLERLAARLAARDDMLELRLDAAGKQLGTLGVEVSASAQHAADGWRLARDAPLSGRVQVSVPALGWLGPLLLPGAKTAGQLEARATLSGTPAKPDLDGALRGENLLITLADYDLRLKDGSMKASLSGDRLVLDDLSFVGEFGAPPRDVRIDFKTLASQPGRLSGRGEYSLASGEGEFEATAERLPILQRADRWLVVSGQGKLVMEGARGHLSGRAAVDAGYFELAKAGTPELSDDVVIVGRDAPAARAAPVTVDAEIDLGRRLFLVGRGLDTRMVGRLHVKTDASGRLGAAGVISARDGTFKAYGTQLTIERGSVNFQGPLGNPGLNVLALRKNLPVEAGVEITGTAARPRVRLVSQPNVPDSEKLSWIVFGRSQDQAAGGESTALLSAAASILGGPEQAGLARGFGLDEVGIRQGELSSGAGRAPVGTVASGADRRSDTVSSEIVTVGKRLSAQAYLSYEQALGGAGSVVKLTYQVTRRFSVIVRAGTDNALDFFYTIAFQ